MLKPSRGLAPNASLIGVERGERLLEHEFGDFVGEPRLLRQMQEIAGRRPEPVLVAPAHQHFQRIDLVGAEVVFGLKRAADPAVADRLAQRIVLPRPVALAPLDIGFEQPRAAARAPRLARRGPGLAAQALGGGVARGPETDAGRHGGEDLDAVDQAGLARPRGEPPRRRQRLGLVAGGRENGAEFVRPDPRHQILRARLARQPLANPRRQRLARFRAVEGDDLGIALDRDQGHREGRLVRSRRDHVGERVVAEFAVGQAGGGVEIGACEQVVLHTALRIDVDRRHDAVAAAVKGKAARLDELRPPFNHTLATDLCGERAGAGAVRRIGKKAPAGAVAQLKAGPGSVEGGGFQLALARAHVRPGCA